MPAPALLVHGPTGCGKTDICSTILRKMYDPFHVQISCDTYSTSKQLLKALWIEISYTKFKFENKNASGKLSKNFLAYQNSIGFRSPANFGDLASLLGPFLDTFLACKNSFYSTHNISNVKETVSENITVPANKAVDSTSNTTVQNKSKKGGEKRGSIFGYSPSDGTRREGVIYLMLDRIDSVERLEKGLTNSLLRLSEVFNKLVFLFVFKCVE